MKKRSIKVNAILNSIRIIMNIIFPLITFPYAARVLGTENIGKIQFSSSITVFVSLFAALGISNYAAREGAALRDDRKKISNFASSIFSLNLIFTFIAYIVLFLLLMMPTKLASYKIIILILSIQVLFTTLGVDWVNNVYEDYMYITVRTIISQLIALSLTFIFIKKPNDYYIYAIITVVANSVTNILNYFHVRKYCDVHFTLKNNYRKHMKPILILFAYNLAQQIYINSDSIMLGMLATDYNVGLYSVAVKIYSMVKALLNGIITVAIPRMAYYSSKYPNKFCELGEKIFKSSILFLLPVVLLLFLLSDNIVIFLSGYEFVSAGLTIKILSLGLIFAVFANLFCNGVLIVKKKEKYVLKATIIAALVNLILNIFFINIFQQNGAAITTVLSEFIVMFYTYKKAKKYLKIKDMKWEIFTEFLGSVSIVFCYCLLIKIELSIFLSIIFITLVCCLTYLITLYILKNKTLMLLVDEVNSKVKLYLRC